ncbi:MAG: VTT domain-containing protein [Reyranellaceae bacterium]
MLSALKRALVRLPLVLAVTAAILFLALGGTHYVSLTTLAENTRWLRHNADDWGMAAPFLFIAATAALLMVLVVPAWFCTIIGGLLFGRWLGAAYALLATTLGASGVFLIARAGLDGLAERAGPRAARIATGFRENALSYLVFLRLVPIVPFTLVNFAAALARLKLRTFGLGTLIGIFPSVLIYASLGDLLMDLARQGQLPDSNLLHQPQFLLPLLGLAALALLPVVVQRWLRRRGQRLQ